MEVKEIESLWNKQLFKILDLKLAQISKKKPKNLTSLKIPKLLEKMTEERLKEKQGKNQFLIISGPSGVGRTTIGQELKKLDIKGIPHWTTRPPRSEMEKKSGDYIYVSKKEFEKAKKESKFLQEAQTYGEWRGITKSDFENLLKSKQKFYIDKSVWTTQKLIKKKEVSQQPHLRTFILPPSFKELVKRLKRRTEEEKTEKSKKIKTLSQKEISGRLKKAVEALKESPKIYDAYIVNDRIPRVVKKIITYL